MSDNRYFLGITGASGFFIGRRIAELLSKSAHVHLCVTKAGLSVMKHENQKMPNGKNISLWDEYDLNSPVCSGSYRLNGCVIAPCSTGTMSRIANGISSNLIERAADVALKERWPLIIVLRETPLNTIHIENMLKLSKAGAIIMPAVLTFYHNPQNITDMVDFIIGRIFDILGVDHNLYKRWYDETEGK